MATNDAEWAIDATGDETEDDAPELTDKEKADILEEVLRKVGRAQTVSRDERKMALQDRRFNSILGAMWEGNFEQQFQNKPKFEVNKIQLSTTRILNEYRANRIGVEFIPKYGNDNPQLIDACAGLYRADEQDGRGEEAFDNGFEEGINGGIGAWRLRTEYVRDDDESDEQRIIFDPINDADTCVYFDLDAKRQDKSDAKWGCILTAHQRRDYETEYDDDTSIWGNIASFPKYITENYNDWLTPDVVYIAQFYRVEEVSTPYVWYKGLNGDIQKFEADKVDADKKKELIATGFKKTKSKSIKVRRIRKFTCSAGKLLKDGGYIAGKEIPIVVYYGKRWWIDNVERSAGHVRYAKDAQRLKNMQLSKLAEISALSSVEKPIFTPAQILGHSTMWERDNIENYPFLLINAVTGADGQPMAIGPQAYTKSPPVPQSLAALLQLTEQDIQDILGNQEAGEQVQANQSGIAVELIQEKLDMQSYIYISNFEKAMKRSGEIWLSMAKDVYIEDRRKMKTLDKSGKMGTLELKQPIVSKTTGVPTIGNDLTEANFDCVAKAGPNTASKRANLTKQMAGMLQFIQDPQTISILVSMIMMNIEGEGVEDVRKYFRQRLLQMGVVTPTPEEQKDLQAQAANQQPDPQTTYLNAAAAEAKATAASKVADMELTAAKVELTKAQAAAAVKGMQSTEIENALKVIDSLTAAQEAQANAASAHADAAQTNATPPPQPAAQ